MFYFDLFQLGFAKFKRAFGFSYGSCWLAYTFWSQKSRANCAEIYFDVQLSVTYL